MSRHEFLPSWFSAVICPLQSGASSDHMKAEFADVVKVDPDVTIVTDSFSVLLATSGSTQVAVDLTKQVVLVLHGEIYNHQSKGQAEFLIKEHIRNPGSFAQNLDGSFALLTVDKRIPSLAVVTDRINSRTVFCSRYRGSTWLSTSLDLHPIADVRPDIMSVAWYMANRFILNGRTLFDSTRILEHASVHSFTDNGFKSTRYWSPELPESYSRTDEKNLRADLADLLVDSVKKRLSALKPRKVFLSLSGGYDSSGILGVLRCKLNVDHLQCYSYGLHKSPPGSDAYVARQMATEVGCDIRVVDTYDGDLPRLIETNARLSHGLSDTYMVDSVLEMASDFSSVQPSVVFIGDERWGERQSRSMSEAMRDVRGFGELHWLRPMLGSESFRTLRDALEDERSLLMSRCPDTDDYHQVDRFLRLESVGRFLATRQLFHGKYITVCNPWLDNSVLDFMIEVPPHLKRKRVLYTATVEGLFPQIFRFDRTQDRDRNVVPDWGTEIDLHRSSLETSLSRSSRLDDLIPPEVIKRLLRENVPAQFTEESNASRPWEPSRWLLARTSLGAKVAKVVSRRKRAKARSRERDRLDRNGFLMRLLIMRSVLTKR